MKKYFLFLSFAVAVFSTVTFAQTPPVVDNKDVVIITTNLIQVDATVTDKKGNIVTNLVHLCVL